MVISSKILISNKNIFLRKKIFFLKKFLESNLHEEKWEKSFFCFSSVIKQNVIYRKAITTEYLIFLVRKDQRISYSLRIEFQDKIFQIEHFLDHPYKNNFLIILTRNLN